MVEPFTNLMGIKPHSPDETIQGTLPATWKTGFNQETVILTMPKCSLNQAVSSTCRSPTCIKESKLWRV